ELHQKSGIRVGVHLCSFHVVSLSRGYCTAISRLGLGIRLKIVCCVAPLTVITGTQVLRDFSSFCAGTMKTPLRAPSREAYSISYCRFGGSVKPCFMPPVLLVPMQKILESPFVAVSPD